MVGVKMCFSSRKSSSSLPKWINKNIAIDDGGPIADVLQLETENLDHSSSSISEDELYFYAVDPDRAELAFHSMAAYIEKTCQAAVVFTGYYSDKIWGANLEGKYLTGQMIRGDISGLRLSEIRLKSGFIHVAVPFMMARSIESLLEVSRSPEMAPWRLLNSYDRPIPRRIGESAGIGRRLFGVKKKVSRSAFSPRNAQLREQFFEFIREEYNIQPWFVYLHRTVNKGAYLFVRMLYYAQNLIPQKILSLFPLISVKPPVRENMFWREIDFNSLIFFWSVEILSRRTANILKHCSKVSL